MQQTLVFHDRIGSGAFATVYKCSCPETGNVYAAKRFAAINIKKAGREAHMLHTAHLMSPKYVPEFVAISRYDTGLFAHSEHKDDIYILQSLCPGEPIPTKVSTYSDLKIIMKHTMSALRDVHRAGIIHMDVKHDNIIRENGGNSFKLVDFGSAIYVDAERKPTRGTPEYMAPEVILNDASFESDVWSAGVMAYQLAYGKFPFHYEKSVCTIEQVFANILENEPRYGSNSNSNSNDECQDFLRLCLCKDKTKRPAPAELLTHAFINS